MNLTYTEFKQEVTERFISYLPEEYHEQRILTENFPKVNGFKEGFNVLPKSGTGVSPTFYFEDLYRNYVYCGDLQQVLEETAEEYLKGMEFVKEAALETQLEHPEQNIILALVDKGRNEELLKGVPYREFLDLAVIYRLIIPLQDNGFNSAIVGRELADSMGLSEEELFRKAMENTPRLMKPLLEYMGEGFWLLTNEYRTMGAALVLYPQILEFAAERVNADLVVIPSSIHECFLVPNVFDNPEELKEVVQFGNTEFCDEREILSESVYLYSRAEKKLSIAG